MKKVVIIQRTIPQYRIEFFSKLYEKLKEESIQLVVVHSSKNLKNDTLFFYIKPTIEKNIKLLLNEKFILSFGLYKYLKKCNPNLILTEDISNLPNGLLVFLYSKIHKSKYAILGLGRILSKKDSFLKKILKVPINLFRNGSSFFISYSSTGAKYYEEMYNKKSVSWNNSVRNVQNINLKQIRVKYETNKLNILFIGRIEKFKKLDLLIDTISAINNINLNLTIIGDGPELNNLKLKYSNCTFILWLGKITEQSEKEKYFLNTHLGIMPGSGGLVIQELQSYGIPIISSYSDGTEVDLIQKVNHQLFIEKMNQKNLENTIQEFIKLSVDDKVEISLKACEVTKNSYNLDYMTEKTINCIKEEI